jgi:HlyD family secretion protein
MTANADILIERRSNVLKVPVAALRFKPADQRVAATGRVPGMGGTGFGSPGGGRQGGGRQAGGGQNAGADGGGRGGGRGMFSEEAQLRLWAELALDDAQKKKAKAIQDETRAAMTGNRGDRDAMRKAAEDGRTKFEAILRPDQRAKLPAIRAKMQAEGGGRRRGGMQPGTVYFLKDNKPVAVPVMVGPSDGTFTEIRPINGNIKQGDVVITGGGPAPKPQARAMMPGMGGNQQRR